MSAIHQAKTISGISKKATYSSKWWTVQLTENWQGKQLDIFDLLTSKNVPGEIRIGALKKKVDDESQTATDADLQKWAQTYSAGTSTIRYPSAVHCGAFVGLFQVFQENDEYSRQWLLRSGDLIIIFTHVCDPKTIGRGDDIVDGIVDTLQVNK